MQRSISDQKPLIRYFVYLGLYILYSSLGTIYPVLPPLLALLFALYAHAMQKENFTELLFVIAALLLFEANYGFLLFSSIIYFYIQYKFILPKIKQNISCKICVKIFTVIVSYLGYFFFLSLLANIFLLESPSFSYYIIYYIVIEFFLVSLL